MYGLIRQAVEALAKRGFPVRIIVRTKERGLSSAVLRGFKEAQGTLLLCMDADLQHPPEKVPELFQVLEKNEFVIGTRYASGDLEVDKDWPLYRQVRFFGIQRYVLERGEKNKISPIGFKIAMELFVKCQVERHGEVPIAFGVRMAGESKLSSKVIYNYLQHLGALYLFKFPFVVAMLALVSLAVFSILLAKVKHALLAH
ncbi:dolichol-P-mannose synthesis [Kappamyces sp. JEL0829]|nr:dolichol-P-mannose synthesis [Kappamyces sp. JEL0829]